MLEDRKAKQDRRKAWAAEMQQRITDAECARGSHRTLATVNGNKKCANCATPLCNHYRSSLMGCMLKRGHSGKHANPNNTRLLFADDGAASLDNWSDDEGRYVECAEDWHALVSNIGKHCQD